MSGDGTATVQAEDADVEFFHGTIAKKWGLCLWDEDCPEGEFCQKHHCEVRQRHPPHCPESAAALRMQPRPGNRAQRALPPAGLERVHLHPCAQRRKQRKSPPPPPPSPPPSLPPASPPPASPPPPFCIALGDPCSGPGDGRCCEGACKSSFEIYVCQL